MRTLVIIPALNEEASIARVVRDIKERVTDADVLVINDGSTDNTARVARAAGAIVVTHPYNMGVGAALRTGFRYASTHNYDRVVQCDADGQHPPSQISLLLTALDTNDLVIGSRFIEDKGSYSVGFVRGFAMRIIRLLLQILTRKKFTDPTSGFRAFSKDMVDKFSTTYPREFLSDTVEALLIACYGSYKVSEVYVEMKHRETGEPSHTSIKLMYQYIHLVLVIFLTASLKGRSR